MSMNTEAVITKDGQESGTKTEVAMLKFLQDGGYGDYQELREYYYKLEHKIFPFNSKRKRSSIVITVEGNTKRVHVKGASEQVFAKCQYILTEDGSNVINIDDSVRESFMDKIFSMNRKGLRTICLAYRDLGDDFDYTEVDEEGNPMVENVDFICIGIVGIKDPVRNEVPDAIKDCKRAHIRVRMVTGDNEITARAIAEQCGIVNEGSSVKDCVISGKDFHDAIGGIMCDNCN